ncbi:DUF423 domain-containing protein [Paenibacillus lentus]|uniref:DUF423 domain-containing protein n=1 Tax=Paenibacillus lentus TaxID=1338368 RepID=A0A3Q8S636_9BACL|nr:DUF423 domain-containing protein [Paenibacillus lentus]AZK48164.1 DUF423 domain-containing protein [Paenibacillus lentus]
MQRKIAGIGAIIMLLAVALGAFGAHVLEPIIQDSIETYKTGVQYHMIHGIGIILVALAAGIWGESGKLRWSAWLFLIGIVLFSGSLYLLSVMGWRWLGPITPLGGVSFIAGWLLLALSAWDQTGQK